ncbi:MULTISPECIES: VOC family protein [Bradyrhizobium]|uniref:VOC family protein n=1 Tax=Bradyrhizobium TaxID=374 RepID=UPI0004181A39|nr:MULTISPECIES: VOC family protein [Bradyrhizobium]WLB90859.1 VOC family protein [Bradyrhizobium japonicum USDA 135]GLR98132.1 lactoylglutathione lyase [Bradyrhizobium liaoningense]
MSQELAAPLPRLTVVTLGVSDIRASIAFYDALGFSRRLKATGEAVAFYDAGGPVLALYPWDQLAADATLQDAPRPSTFRGMTLAWNCRTREEVDAVLAFAIRKGASLLKAAHETDYGGYSGYFTDPDGHPWEVVVAPGIEVGEDRRVHLAD